MLGDGLSDDNKASHPGKAGNGHKKKVPKELKKLDNGIKKLDSDTILLGIINEVHKEGVVDEEDNILLLVLKISLRLVVDAHPTSSNITLTDDSGIGKDWLSTKVAKVMVRPSHYIHKTGLSLKSFVYMKPENTSETWDNYVLHLEDPDPEFISTEIFKKRVSNKNLDSTTVIKNKAVNIKQKGKPVIIVTSLNQKFEDEDIRRWDSTGLHSDKELTRQIMLNIAKIEQGIAKYNPDNEIREALHNLQPKKVVIPYALELIENNILPYKLMMRTYTHKFFDFIKASAVLHQHQRKKIDTDTIEANFFDLVYSIFAFVKLYETNNIPLGKRDRMFLDALSTEFKAIRDIASDSNIPRDWIYDNKSRLQKLKVIVVDDRFDPDANKPITKIKKNIDTLADDSICRSVLAWLSGGCGKHSTERLWQIGKFFEINTKINENRKKIGLDPLNVLPYTKTTKTTTTKDIEQYHNHAKTMPQPKAEHRKHSKDVFAEAHLHDKIKQLKDFINDNREANRVITYGVLTHSFASAFIDNCIRSGILVKNGDEFVFNG